MDKFSQILETLSKNTRSILACIIITGGFIFLFMIAVKPIPPANKDIIQVVSGLVLGILATTASYYFGSSKDKSDNDKALIEKDKQESTNKI